jgi:hypothetical protein
MWTISDFPACGLISGICTKGYLACPICGPNTVSRAAKGPRKLKQVFVGAHGWTRRNHSFQVNLRFNGEVEHGTTPTRQSASDILNSVSTRRRYLEGSRSGRCGRPDGPHDLYKRLGV